MKIIILLLSIYKSNNVTVRSNISFKLISLCSILFIVSSCNKVNNTENTPTPIPIPTPPPSPTVIIDNKWECTIDGINYSGTIDTSFIKINNPTYPNPDTIVNCTGTTPDKKANIFIWLRINRTTYPASVWNSSAGNEVVVFDTLSSNFLLASTGYYAAKVFYSVDTLKPTYIKANFYGTLSLKSEGNLLSGTRHIITNGKISCEFGKGNNEPKKFSFNAANTLYAGVFSQAIFNSNTLILDGEPYAYGDEQIFKLIIHTGASIQPGIYESSKEQIGLSFYSPSRFVYYVDDSLGNLKVTISSVNGNIISGSFEGVNYNGLPISNGKFNCRIKNYQPYIDSLNKWKYIQEDIVYNSNPFMIYGGNILNATKTFSGNRYYLTVKGESDNLVSKFKLVIASNSPIDTGNYISDYVSKSLDTLNITSGTINIDNFIKPSNGVFCHIDTINSSKVTGTFRQTIVGNPSRIRQGNFRANF